MSTSGTAHSGPPSQMLVSVCPIFCFSSASNASFQTLASDAGRVRRAEEVVSGLGVPLETVERHAHSLHEVGAAYLSCAGKSIFEFRGRNPFQFDDPPFEVRRRYGLQPQAPLHPVHGNRLSRSPEHQRHSARRPDCAQVDRTRFLVRPSEFDPPQQIAFPLHTEQFVGQFRREIEVEVRDLVAEFDPTRFVLVPEPGSVLPARYRGIPQAARRLTKIRILVDYLLFFPQRVCIDFRAVGNDVLDDGIAVFGL